MTNNKSKNANNSKNNLHLVSLNKLCKILLNAAEHMSGCDTHSPYFETEIKIMSNQFVVDEKFS
jgi:hypothetical protein